MLGLALLDLLSWLYRSFYRTDYAYVRTIDGADFYVATSPKLRARFSKSGTQAFALGSSVYVRAKHLMTPALVRHELAHVRQARTHGILFPLRYYVEHVRRGYHRNRFELAARRAERYPSRLRSRKACMPRAPR